VLEELLEAMDIPTAVGEDDSDEEVVVEEQEVMTLQSESLKQSKGRQTMKLCA
jgi:hypothetical protein